MKRTIFVCFGLLLLSIRAAGAEGLQSAGYRIEPDVLSGGGGTFASADNRLAATLGQPSTVGVSVSASYKMLSGFWYQLFRRIAGGDVNGDGRIDLQDAVLALQIVAGFSPAGIQRSADVSGDMAVGMQEAIFVLQKIATIG